MFYDFEMFQMDKIMDINAMFLLVSKFKMIGMLLKVVHG